MQPPNTAPWPDKTLGRRSGFNRLNGQKGYSGFPRSTRNKHSQVCNLIKRKLNITRGALACYVWTYTRLIKNGLTRPRKNSNHSHFSYTSICFAAALLYCIPNGVFAKLSVRRRRLLTLATETCIGGLDWSSVRRIESTPSLDVPKEISRTPMQFTGGWGGIDS